MKYLEKNKSKQGIVFGSNETNYCAFYVEINLETKTKMIRGVNGP